MLTAGCLQPDQRFPLAPLPLANAAGIVNANIRNIPGTIRAVGNVDIRMRTPEGRERTFHTDGVLFYLGRSNVRFDIKALGKRQFLFGSNERDFWVFDGQEEKYECGRYDYPGEFQPHFLIHPRELIDAIGLTPIPIPLSSSDEKGQSPSTSDDRDGPSTCVQRVVDDYQQVLFVSRDPLRHAILKKEYWLDRYAPRLIRRVIFRDADGIEQMKSELENYRVVPGSHLLLPHSIAAEWPDRGMHLRFQVRQWTFETDIGPNDIQFRTPTPCRSGAPDR